MIDEGYDTLEWLEYCERNKLALAYNDLMLDIVYSFSKYGLGGMLKVDKWKAAEACIYAIKELVNKTNV